MNQTCLSADAIKSHEDLALAIVREKHNINFQSFTTYINWYNAGQAVLKQSK